MKSSAPDPNHHSPLSPSAAYTETIYRGQVTGNNGSEDTDELTLGGRLQDIYTTRGGVNSSNNEKRKSKTGRNFAWNDTENKST